LARRAFSLLPLVAGTALAGAVVVLGVNGVLEGLRLRHERDVRENLQTVWIAANQYFIQNNTGEVTVKDLVAASALGEIARLSSLKSVVGEDYQNVNKGVIRGDATELVVEYTRRGKPCQVTYEVPKRVAKARRDRK
jgi:hypothetical protein